MDTHSSSHAHAMQALDALLVVAQDLRPSKFGVQAAVGLLPTSPAVCICARRAFKRSKGYRVASGSKKAALPDPLPIAITDAPEQ